LFLLPRRSKPPTTTAAAASQKTPKWLPESIFKKGQLVLIRECNPNQVLKPGEQAGKNKLKGVVRGSGPFQYNGVSPHSKRYCEVEDAKGNVWDKAFHNLIPFSSMSGYRVADFPLPTREVLDLEESWSKSPPSGDYPTNKKRKRRDNPDAKEYQEDALYHP